MLHFIQSNQQEYLLTQLIERLQGTADPFEPLLVMVPSQAMARWISLQMAQQTGICAHVQFLGVESFFHYWLQQNQQLATPVADLNQHMLTLAILPKLLQLREQAPDAFISLHYYLQQQGDSALWSLAQQLAQLIRRYDQFRPDWFQPNGLAHWNPDSANPNQMHWQAALWQELSLAAPSWQIQQLLHDLQQTASSFFCCPTLHLFGLSSLSPLYVQAIQQMSLHCDVNLYALNPSPELWGETDASIGERLLKHLGQQQRDFFRLIHPDLTESPVPVQRDEYFAPPVKESLLQQIQCSLLCLEDPIAPRLDASIQVHDCHSPLREVEVLQDQLLAMLESDPSLKPSDIIVMMPDIQAYLSAVQAIFGSAPLERQLPFGIADQQELISSSWLQIYTLLLELPRSTFDATSLLQLLNFPSLKRKFDLYAVDLDIMQHWLQDAAIYQGQSWQQGMERLLLGTMMGRYVHLIPEVEIYPATAATDQARDLGRWVEAILRIVRWCELPALPLSDWLVQWHELLQDLFTIHAEEKRTVEALQFQLQSLQDACVATAWHEPIPYEIAQQAILQSYQMQHGRATGFLAGGITFCQMTPMRAIPFRVICLLGMNQTDFPRRPARSSLDLMVQDSPRVGDRNPEADDRALFLDVLLSTRDVLYLSYVGRSQQDNQRLSPSSLLLLLQEEVEKICGAWNVQEHKLQNFHSSYFQDEMTASFANEIAQAMHKTEQFALQPFVAEGESLLVPQVSIIQLSDFCHFFENTSSAFLRAQLGIYFSYNRKPAEDLEPFIPSSKSKFLQWQRWREQMPLDAQFSLFAKAQQILPAGSIGQVNAEQIYQDLLLQHWATPRESLPFELNFDGLVLYGVLPDVAEDGLIAGVSDKYWDNLKVRARILHMVWQCVRTEQQQPKSYWITPEKTETLEPINRSIARQRLAAWLQWYVQGQGEPMPFFPKTSLALLSPKTEELQWEKAFSCWDEEGQDPAHALAWRGRSPLDHPAFPEITCSFWRVIAEELHFDQKLRIQPFDG